MTAHPRILVTGFSVFPGAPVNPTEALVGRLRAEPPIGAWELRAEVLAVEYAGIGPRLEQIGKEFPPDISIHFGLAREAKGFRLERVARNEIRKNTPDNAGYQPEAFCIWEGGQQCVSTLPLDMIEKRLMSEGLPVSWSDDAGGYLCNYLFYLSASTHFPHFAPDMTGFIHVPPLAAEGDAPTNALTLQQLERGARVIIETCAQMWVNSRREDQPAAMARS